jgi:hypothetical protein
MAMSKYGDKKVPESNEGFLDSALRGGGMGPSKGIVNHKVARGQTIKTATPQDNIQLAYPTESSIREEGGFRGSPTNLKHSIEGAEAVDPNNPGAAGPVRHTIIADH